jgi:N-acetylglutamate synthase-like GNAT family acetyltransferase
MTYDAALALRMITNNRLRAAQACEYRDVDGALVVTSDTPIPALNALNGFDADERRIDGVLDVGFALLRAFDCDPAAEVTPLDRPPSVANRLRARGLLPAESRAWMIFHGDVSVVRTNPDVVVRVAGPDDATTFASIHAGGEKWMKQFSLAGTLTGMHEDGNTFYIGELEGRAVGVLHLLRDGATAGLYAATTIRPLRRRGVCSTLVARAIVDAQSAGCDVICLSAAAGSDAERLYTALGFERSFESVLWTTPQPVAV